MSSKVSPKEVTRRKEEGKKYINPFYDEGVIKKATGFKWWEKILLPFCITYVALDIGGNDEEWAVFYKNLFGKIYIIRDELSPYKTL